jgi:hypothetical protein
MPIKHKMIFSKYKYFYVNGCSHSEGGGLEEPNIKSLSPVPIYEKLYGITWGNRKEVNYGKRLSDIIGVPCINESMSGSGVDRIVRKTYDFIYENWEERDKFFIILEVPDPSRSDVLYSPTKEYFIVNSIYDAKINDFKFSYATREYFNLNYLNADKEMQGTFNKWFDNHYDHVEKLKSDERSFIGLYSFCKLNGIKIFVMNTTFINECFDKKDILNFDNTGGNYDLLNWCVINKMTVYDETKGEINDMHPGYYGHIEYAKKVAKYMGWAGEYKIIENKKKLI